MSLEILLPRRLAPDLGTALPVWTAAFATVLLGLAIGSSLGRSRDDDDPLGRRSAAGAIGSVAGTWITSYVVIPSVDVPTAFLAVAALVAVAGALRAGRDRAPAPAPTLPASATEHADAQRRIAARKGHAA